MIDTVLGLQHVDGGFNPRGNGGACEDVDSVDILLNLYKRFDYRRADIRFATEALPPAHSVDPESRRRLPL